MLTVVLYLYSTYTTYHRLHPQPLHIFRILIKHAIILIVNYVLLKISCVIQWMLSGAIGIIAIEDNHE